MTWRAAAAKLGGAWFARVAAAAPAPATSSPATGLTAVDGLALRAGGRYRLQRELGRGAVGTVYLAIDTESARPVAVKLMPRAQAAPQEGVAPDDASEREWRAARRLKHPGIVALIDAGSDERHFWVVSEYAPGVNLSRYVRPPRLLPEPLVLRIGAQLTAALAHAHAQGVVHRDLKPANVLLELPAGIARLIDFGVARIDDGFATRTGMTLGTPSYMAPEQLAGAPATAATDVYALGVVLFELLSGRRPHVAATLGELLRAVGDGQAARLQPLCPGLDGGAVAAVESMLERNPDRRPSDLIAHSAKLQMLAEAALAPPLPGA